MPVFPLSLPRGDVLVNGRPVLWAVLEDGDSIELGPYRLQLRLL